MNGVVVEVGPGEVRAVRVGAGGAQVTGDPQLTAAAIDCIDDETALIDEVPVGVRELWCEILRSLVGGTAETVTLVFPSWWMARRIDLVRDAARSVAAEVVVRRRSLALAQGQSNEPRRPLIIAEVAAQLVAVTCVPSTASGQDYTPVHAEPRSTAVDSVADGVARTAGRMRRDLVRRGETAAIMVDAPPGIAGADTLSALIADRLRANGVTAVSIPDGNSVLTSAVALQAKPRPVPTELSDRRESWAARLWRPSVAVLAGVSVSAAALGAVVVRPGDHRPPVSDLPMTLLVEGHVAVKVPARWLVQRITSGPGSARVQVTPPAEADFGLHVTQSRLPGQLRQDQAAATLKRAVDEQPQGVFVDFNPMDRRADRPAVTYREIRAGHSIYWAVLVDGSVRISIGCQSPPGREHAVAYVCDRAVESAHAVP
jgi:type VII secretion-associated protein (TIGR03931 family)